MTAISRRRFLAYGMTTAAAAAVVAGCGSPSSASSKNAASGTGSASSKSPGTSTRKASTHAPAGSEVTYSLWSVDNAVTVAVFQKTVAAYNETASQKIKFKISTLPGSGATLYPSKIQSLISAGNEPDLFFNWVGTLASPFVDEHAVQPLTAWYDKYNWKKILEPAAINYVTFNGAPYEVPFGLVTLPVWYNTKLFAKAGATPPTTYSEWETANRKLSAKGITPAIEAEIDGWDIMRLFEQLLEMTAGPALHDKLLKLEASWDDPTVAQAFELLKEWGDNNWLEKGYSGVDPNTANLLFTGSKGAQSLQGPWEVANLQAAKANLDDFSIFVPPTKDGTKPRLGGFAQGYMISSHLTGERFDVLGDFWNWFIQPTTMQKFLYGGQTATINGIPAGNRLASLADKITHDHEAYLIQDEALGTALANAYFGIQAKVSAGSITSKAAATQMQAAVEKQKNS